MAVAFQDYYKTLGVSREAADKEIKSAYRSLARKWHPDAHQGADKAEAEKKFKQINEAYEVLSDPDKKSKYDRLGANWQAGQDFKSDMNGFHFYSSNGSSDFSDFFESLFGGGGFSFNADRASGGFHNFKRTPRQQTGQDTEFILKLSLEEAYQGIEKSVRTPDGQIIKVKIPPKIREGQKIRLKGQGGQGLNGGANGDLYIQVKFLPHPLYEVKGNNLETIVKIRPDEAVLGTQKEIKTLDGQISLKIPPRTSSQQKLRLKGQGLPVNSGRGDLLVQVQITLPDDLSEAELKLYQQLSDLRK